MKKPKLPLTPKGNVDKRSKEYKAYTQKTRDHLVKEQALYREHIKAKPIEEVPPTLIVEFSNFMKNLFLI